MRSWPGESKNGGSATTLVIHTVVSSLTEQVLLGRMLDQREQDWRGPLVLTGQRLIIGVGDIAEATSSGAWDSVDQNTDRQRRRFQR
jgi:hypothetical protein